MSAAAAVDALSSSSPAGGRRTDLVDPRRADCAGGGRTEVAGDGASRWLGQPPKPRRLVSVPAYVQQLKENDFDAANDGVLGSPLPSPFSLHRLRRPLLRV
jgi:hypothetical protein